MPAEQPTLNQLWGKPAAAGPKQQSKLTFSSKSNGASKAKAKDGDQGAAVEVDSDQLEKEGDLSMPDAETAEEKVTKKSKSEDAKKVGATESKETKKPSNPASSKSAAKQGKSSQPVKKKEIVEIEDDEDDEPIVVRPKRKAPKFEDEDDDVEMEEPQSKSKTKSASSAKDSLDMPPPAKKAKKEPSAKDMESKKKSSTKELKSKKNSSVQVPKKESSAKDVESKKESSPKDMEPKSASRSRSASVMESEVDEEDEDDVKPELAAKAREKIQTTLISKGKDLYPDWKAGDPVPYAALCATFSVIEMTTKRLEMTSHASLFLRQVLRLTPSDLLPTVMLMINKLASDYAGIELGIGESIIMKAIGESTGRSLAVIKKDQQEIGDLGLVAVKSRSNQPTMFKPKPLTIRGVHTALLHIATMQGHGAQQRKTDAIKKLLSAADGNLSGKIDITQDKGGASEAKYIVRFLEGKLRLGLAEKTVLVSLAQAMVCHETESEGSNKIPSTDQLAKAEAILKTVYSELPSYDVIIPAMLEHGIFKLSDQCKLQPGVPLKPMLAKPTKAITEVLDRFENQTFTCEYKYDGERAQIHYVAKDSPVKYASGVPGPGKAADGALNAIFSRNSEDLSKKYPDILAKLNTWVKPDTKSFVMDCETVAWDLEEKKVLPFQQLMTRKKKDVKVEDVKVKVCVFAFDLLFLNDVPLVEKSLRERRQLMHDSFQPVEGELAFATSMDGQELEEIQIFLDESVKASCEGLMVKMLDGKESGYEPSKRSRNWLKIKKDYLAGIGDSLDLVVLGAYFGKGKRTGAYGAFLLACHNPSAESYETICNIGTGFSESVLEELHQQLAPLVIAHPKPFYSHSAVKAHEPDVWFDARYVWEVKAADLTLSPRYHAAMKEGLAAQGGEKGVSLRFPRFIRIREDKKPAQATSSRQVAEMYTRQESVGKNKGPAVDDDFEY